ncbi:MAG: anaerobic ribonucleoside-triphosphate reductase activating protein [Burkholderiales bacterium]
MHAGEAVARRVVAVTPAQAGPSRLHVGGFVPFTTTDYPDALSAVVFCQGCPWECAYCHNPHLMPSRGTRELDFAAIAYWLATRRGLLDAVVFSGGEPTAQAALLPAIESVRALGFAVGLHTSGAYPRRLAEALPRVNWVGLDVKAPATHYEAVTGTEGSGHSALASLELVLRAGIAYEVRTTVHPALTPPDALEALARDLAARGVVRWIVQPFRPTGCANPTLIASAPEGVVLDGELLARLSAHVPIIELRA